MQGTTTNNRAILKFIPVFKDCSVPETSINISIIVLKYEYRKFAPTFTVGLGSSYRFGHLFRTCAQFYNTLIVKSLAPEESPSNPSFSLTDNLASASSGPGFATAEPTGDDPLGGVIINLMGRASRFRRLGLNVQDKSDFLDYFILRNNGIRTAKRAIPQKSTTSSSSGRSKKQ